MQKLDGPPLSLCQVWWGSWVARRLQTKKCDVFCSFFCFFFVTLWNYEVCGNGNAMKRCNFQNNYGKLMMSLHRGRFVVVHLYSTFSVNHRNFPIGVNL